MSERRYRELKRCTNIIKELLDKLNLCLLENKKLKADKKRLQKKIRELELEIYELKILLREAEKELEKTKKESNI